MGPLPTLGLRATHPEKKDEEGEASLFGVGLRAGYPVGEPNLLSMLTDFGRFADVLLC